jgi:hypothetical protein
MLPELALPQVAALLVLLGLALVFCAMGWRWWTSAGTEAEKTSESRASSESWWASPWESRWRLF